ncbi:MAG TPA: hypothetical protein IAB98_10280 [Candidatus Egerieimonas intestinavium]|uniref:SdpI family protein n=1 Tax=Candidatus Egerieimonas intestinavium TaxID=2840777 RepID=A0A9D1JGT4_9FIRM|nr:hypothetical protein [Candidatus Egerieimonas intestinavium]
MGLVLLWCGGLLCLVIGFYTRNQRKPMCLWGGLRVWESQVKNVQAYNRAVGRMWCVTSIPFWICGLIVYVYPPSALIIFGLFCTVGMGLMLWYYHKIQEKYFLP